MKRLLSVILAAAMLISFVPVFSASAEGETAVTETISYQIKRDSLSTESYSGEHHIPMVNGKLSFTRSGGATYTGANTIFNVVLNLNGNYTSDTSYSSVANSEISFLTYRNIEYYVYGTLKDSVVSYHPTRKFQSNTSTPILNASTSTVGYLSADGTTPKVYSIGPTLKSDLEPFELMGRSQSLSHSFLDNYGYYATMNIGAKGTTYKSTKDTEKEPSFMVRIKIPEDAAAGKYNVKVGNTFAPQDNGQHYDDDHAVLSEVYVTKVGSAGFEGVFDTSGYVANYADSEGNILERSAYAAAENMLTGVYDTEGQSSKLFPDVLEFAPGEE